MHNSVRVSYEAYIRRFITHPHECCRKQKKALTPEQQVYKDMKVASNKTLGLQGLKMCMLNYQGGP